MRMLLDDEGRGGEVLFALLCFAFQRKEALVLV
jgi:hypothetical protein